MNFKNFSGTEQGGVKIYWKTSEVLVHNLGSFDYTQQKIKKGKGHNKLQKRKKK